MKRTLAVDLGGWVLPTPVMIAAGCAGTGRELAGLVEARRIGAIVSRSVTLRPRKGVPTPRIAESPSGVVWSTGLQNPGIEAFIEEELPRLARAGTAVMVSIAGGSLEEYVRTTSLLQGRPEISALEVRLSEPDEELGRDMLGAYPDRAAEIAGAVARMSLVPVFAKLPALSADLVEVARAVVRAGAHGVTLIDPPPGLSIEAARLRPALGSVSGWLSGPAIAPLTRHAVLVVARALPETPILASGGVRTGTDAIELMLAGAWAVQVGTAAMIDPAAPVDIARGRGRVPEGEGSRVSRGRPWPPPGARGRVDGARVIPRPANPLIVALDVSDLDRADELASTLAPHVGLLKVGLELAWAHGPEAVRRIGAHGPVFVDAKLHDIPNTVERAAANIAHLGAAMLTVHALGGDAMMRAARRGADRGASDAGHEPPLILAVTVLSSQSGEDLASPASLAFEAKAAGLDGTVVSGADVRDVRDACGEGFCLVVPGIRPAGSNGDDQVRVLEPEEAIEKGADFLVVGRPITAADDPPGVARALVATIR